jgi:hypothetical protein
MKKKISKEWDDMMVTKQVPTQESSKWAMHPQHLHRIIDVNY